MNSLFSFIKNLFKSKVKFKNTKFLAIQEGIKLSPYLCNRGVPTIGIGNTFYPDTGKKVTLQDEPITQKRAYELLEMYMQKEVYPLIEKHITSRLTQDQFDALCSFIYNLGPQSLKNHNGSDTGIKKQINQDPNNIAIIDEFLKWDRANLPVLARHAREADLYFSHKQTAMVKEKLSKYGTVNNYLYLT